MSIWNEMDSDLNAGGPKYIKQLRKTLDARALQSVRIVAADGHSFGDITSHFKGDPELVRDVDILGAHYPSSRGPGAAGLGKKAWASEEYSQLSSKPVGSMCWVSRHGAGHCPARCSCSAVGSASPARPAEVQGGREARLRACVASTVQSAAADRRPCVPLRP